jgi:hypothetical protein
VPTSLTWKAVPPRTSRPTSAQSRGRHNQLTDLGSNEAAVVVMRLAELVARRLGNVLANAE